MQFVSYFELNASETGGKAKINKFKQDLNISIQHDPDELRGVDVDSLRLFYLDESNGQWLPLKNNNYDKEKRTLTADTNHFTHFGEMANPLVSGPGRVLASQVDLHSGVATYSYPLELPPGPGGFQPKLNLTYNSGSVDEMKNKQSVGSWVGTGWDLTFGKITCDLTNNIYYLDLNGASYQLATTDNTNYYTNPEQYFKIIRTGNTWTLYDKDGYYYQFGGNSDSQQYIYNSGIYYYRWDLSLFKDTNNNQATVTYSQNIVNSSVRSAYPSSLSYGNVQVIFTTAYDENDPTDGYLRYDNPKTQGSNPAPKVMENRKLTSITINFNSSLLRKYTFTYTTTNRYSSTDYSGIYYAGTLTLSSITLVGANGSSTLPATSFTYQNLTTTRQGAESNYTGNPGNPASFSWPRLTVINSGYGGSIGFSYTQDPSTSVTNIWSREVVTTKTVSPGIGTNQTTTYIYTGNPQYLGSGWQQTYRGFAQVQEADSAGNYVIHYFYTTGKLNGVDQDKLAGLEYDTKWYSSSGTLLKETTYNWGWVNTGSTYNVKWIWSTPGAGSDYIQFPYRIGASNNYYVYVPDGTGNSIKKFDEHGNFVLSWGTTGSGNGQFSHPYGVAVNNTSGYVYVVDYSNARIQRFDLNGNFQLKWGSYGSGNGQFNSPTGIAIDSSGNVYVADQSNYRVQKFNANGTYITKWGSYGSGQGQFNQPYSIGVDSINNIYVLEQQNCRIQKFTSSGTYITTWGTSGTGNGQLYYPYDLSVDSQNNVYDTEAMGVNRVQEFNSTGTFLQSWSTGKANIGLTVAQNSMYVTENTPNIQEFIKNWAVQLTSTTTTMGSKSSTVTYAYSNTGNVTAEVRTSSVPSENSTLYREFYPNTSANILNRVAREFIYDSGNNVVKDTRYYYDNNSVYNTSPIAGNLTKLQQMINSSTSVNTNYTYDSYGNQLTVQDPRGYNTTTAYDTTYHMYPATKTYPNSSLTESYTYDPGTTNLLTQTDVNGQVTTYTYDTFKRLTSIDKPGGRNPDITYEYLNWGTLSQQRILTKTYYDSSNYLWSADYFDGLGRVVQKQSNGESGHTIISSTTAYNNCGEVVNEYVSQDFASILTSYQTPGSWNSTSYTYDGLGRVLVQTNPDGTQLSNNYSNSWETIITDALGHRKNYYCDAYQNLIKVEELDSSYNIYGTTNYTYDVLGNLKIVVDNAGNTTSMTYNWLSQKSAMTDPDMGSWSYGYDNNGNLTSQTDAKSQTISMVYDNMNRLTNKNYPAGSGMTNIVYGYDSTSGGNYGKGKRTSMTDAAGTTTYKYDVRSRQIEEKRTIDSVDYTTSYAYDYADRNTTITYPTGEVVTNAYNGRGLPNTLSGSAAGSLVSGVNYNALGLITQITLGNTLKTTYGYYGTGGANDTTGGYYGRLWEIKTLPQSGGTSLQDVMHTWDAVGNLSTRQDVLASETETFGYDFLDRLTGVSGPYTESFTYNTIGNLMSKNGTSYTYGDSNHDHAVTAVGSTSYTYDPNGNMTTRGTQTITWDVENRVTAVSGGVSFVYDGDGNRVKKTEGGQTTLYVNKYYEINITTSTATSNYYLGDKLIAEKTGTTLTFVHQDALTGTSVTTNSSGTSTGTIKYFSFGQTRSGSVSVEQKFTGQRLDGTGLYYYNARYYDPAIGRFISPDTAAPELINPQDLNKYTYVLNNPLKFNDPTGHYWSNPLNIIKGIGISIYNTLESAKNMVVNPVQTYQNVVSAFNSPPGTTFQAIAADYSNKWNSETGRGEILGDAAMTFCTFGEGGVVNGTSKVAKAAEITSGVEKGASAVARSRYAIDAGKAGEAAVNAIKNTERLDSVLGTANYRVPDILDKNNQVLGEIKNVNSLSYTTQLRDYYAIAEKINYKFQLTIRQNTKLSTSLQNIVKSGNITLRYLPW